MPIVGLTHDNDGRPKLRRTVTTKVAIGLPPTDGSNFPKRLDHFVFLKKELRNAKIEWVLDDVLMQHYGQNCRELWITFLDDDPDQIFRTEYAAYVKRGCWCRGDGMKAQRRDLGQGGDKWGEFHPYNGPCAENGCPNLDDSKLPCSPSGDLYFMLADFPSLGSICRWHTGSYQSIGQVYTALHDLRRITGGRLLGVTAKLFMHPDKSVYEQGGQTKTGTKWVLGLELKASDMAGIQTKLLETARVFNTIKGELAGQVLEIDEDEAERGPEIAAEFYPGAKVLPAGEPEIIKPGEDPEKALREEADRLLTAMGYNQAKRTVWLDRNKGNLAAKLPELRAAQPPAKEGSHATSPQAAPAVQAAKPEAQPQGSAAANPQQAPHGAVVAAPAAEDPLSITAADVEAATQPKTNSNGKTAKQGGFDF